MSKETKHKIVPKFRFPEFLNNEEWEKKEFDQLFVIGNGRDYKHLSKGEIPVYGSGGYMLSVNDYLHEGESVCIGRKGTIDKPIFLSGKFWVVDTLFYTHSFKDCLPKFIYSIFQNINWLNHNEAGGVPSLTKTTLNKIEVYVPKPKEQQKIADCLSSLDELISANIEKLEALKTHKKGLMQQLFPAEGETVPKLRFEEFRGDGDWEEKKLGEIGEPLMCKRIFKEETNANSNNGIPFYKIGTFGRIADAYISKELYVEYKSKYSFPNIGDILISAAGTIGRLVIYDGSPAFFQDSNIIWLGHNEEEVQNRFLYYCYSNLRWQTSDGGIISRLYNSDFKAMKIFYPRNKSEQLKISESLSSLDELITSQSEKISVLQEHKKGLMQGLFPIVNDDI